MTKLVQSQQQMSEIMGQQYRPNTGIRALDIEIRPYTEGEDKSFLLNFERSMRLQEIPEEEWVMNLISTLNGRARAAFNEVEVL